MSKGLLYFFYNVLCGNNSHQDVCAIGMHLYTIVMHNVKKAFTFIACKSGLIIMTGSPFFHSECIPSRCLLWTCQWILNFGGGFVFVLLFWYCWGKLLFVKNYSTNFQWRHEVMDQEGDAAMVYYYYYYYCDELLLLGMQQDLVLHIAFSF